MWILLILGASWALKSFLHPVPAVSLDEFVSRSAIGPIHGGVVIAAGLIHNGALFAIGFLTAGLNQASGEALPKWGSNVPLMNLVWRAMEVHEPETDTAHAKTGPQRAGRKRHQLLAFIISNKPQALSDRVLKELRRGFQPLKQ